MSHSLNGSVSGTMRFVLLRSRRHNNRTRRPETGAKSMIELETNVVAFKPRAAAAHHPKAILERVYAAGSIAVRADDTPTKTASLILQAFGFLVVEEVLADGTPRRLERGKAREAMDRPWRLSKPPFSGELGQPDGEGNFRL